MNLIRCLLALLVVLALSAGEAPRTSVQPVDTGAALVNPGMGWTMHFYSNVLSNYGSQLAPSDTVDDFPGLSVVYLRVPWAFLEPQEGVFNWALLDTPAQRWIAKGKRVALRVTCCESWMRNATPLWVQKAGAKGVTFEFGKGPKDDGPLWEPDYQDPVFLARLDRFMTAYAARYDGNPSVDFVDVGSFGMWGEGHTGFGARLDDARTFAAAKTHIDLHRKHFTKTLLCISDDMAGHDRPGARQPITDYALEHGVTLRDDSILVQPPPNSWYHAKLAQAFWPRLPVILEHEHYGGSKQRKAWSGDLLLKSVEDYHASYMSIHWWPRVLLEENRATIERINRRMGYRLQPRSLSWPTQVRIGETFTIDAGWANAGVAPCLPEAFWAITLKDEQGGIVSVHVDEGFDLRGLAPAAEGQAQATARSLRGAVAMRHRDPLGTFHPAAKPATCGVFVSVGRRDGTPLIALPLADDDGQRRYRVGSMQVMAP